MKNITVSVDEETYRRARIRAAEEDTSVSALVKGFLIELAATGEVGAGRGLGESRRAFEGGRARSDTRGQLQALEEIWESLSRDETDFNSPGWHQEAVRETAARYEAGEEGPLDWAAAKRELCKRAK